MKSPSRAAASRDPSEKPASAVGSPPRIREVKPSRAIRRLLLTATHPATMGEHLDEAYRLLHDQISMLRAKHDLVYREMSPEDLAQEQKLRAVMTMKALWKIELRLKEAGKRTA